MSRAALLSMRRPEGVTRRDFMKWSGVAAGGGALPTMFADAGQAATDAGKSIIHIYLRGGPSHLDTFDLKPAACREVRGEFRPIRTSVPGLHICELMPRLAARAHRFTILRSIVGLHDVHAPHLCDSGWPSGSLREVGGRPGLGAVLSYYLWNGPSTPADVTAYDLTGWTSRGFLEPDWRGQAADEMAQFKLRYRRGAELRYAVESHPENELFLAARRLVEAGARYVGFSWGYWDTHGNNFGQLRRQLPALDYGLSALLDDLAASGRLDDTLIFMSGEFGRSPAINDGAGRDHWPQASFAWLAGGGLRHGQAIGSTDRDGAAPKDRPVHIQHIFHTLYRTLGVDADAIRLTDFKGRRHELLAERSLIRELV